LLRLPAGDAHDTKLKHVEQCLKVLGLDHIQNDVVGSPDDRGISGGQKKRVNIGCELVSMPAVIFMDEPTSGLDGAATLELSNCLKQLQTSGLTICCVIHQPRASVFHSFSHLLLLGSSGQQIYCGRSELMRPYLTSLSFRLPNEENPADWMIDVACNLTPRYKHLADEATKHDDDPDAICTDWQAPEGLYTIWDAEHKAKCREYDSPWMKGSPLNDHEELQQLEARECPSTCFQFYYLLSRTFRQYSLNVFLGTCLGLFVVGAAFGAIGSKDYDYKNLYNLPNWSLFTLFQAVMARALFGDEQLTYYRECKSGISSFAYWLSKVIYGLIVGYVYCLMYAIPTYFGNTPMQSFGDLNNNLWASWWYWSGAGMFLSVAISNQSICTLVLIMWNFCEILIDGSRGDSLTYIANMSPLPLFMSSVTNGRWMRQMYFAEEMKRLPSHVQSFTDVNDEFNNNRIPRDLDDAVGQSMLNRFILGMVFRLLALLLLALIKYAQGGGFFCDLWYVSSNSLTEVCCHGDCCCDNICSCGNKRSSEREPTEQSSDLSETSQGKI